MSESKIIQFKITEVKGAMDYNTASLTLSPEYNLIVELEVRGEQNGENFVVSPKELNRLVREVRLMAHVNTAELYEEEAY